MTAKRTSPGAFVASRSRYGALILSLVVILVASPIAFTHHWVWWIALAGWIFGLIGLTDFFQPWHSLLRNYPILAHIRWMAESVRPEIRQYLIESDQDAAPFSRSQRSLVYARAKNEGSERPFGTQLNVYSQGYEFIGHSTLPLDPADPKTFRVKVGGDQCAQPYSASVFNISAMSFGSLSANAVRALNKGAAMGGFYHDTGEGGLSRYHREFGGDLVWEIGSGYFGCRTPQGRFDPERFERKARLDQVKMIEIKLSQGAKPGLGGLLPGPKVSAEIAEARQVPQGVDCISPVRHSAFSTPIEMMHFIAKLRALSGGKPVGFKMCLGHPWEFMGMVKAMLETGIRPDFVVVDGAEGGTGAAPLEFSDHLGVPMREGLLFVHNTLVGAGLRDQVRVAAAGKVISAFDIASVLAIGADWTNAARGYMFALGCVQSLTCNTNRCPTGVATQDRLRQRALVVPDKAQRVCNYHGATLKGLSDMLAAAGLSHPEQLGPQHLARRVSATAIRQFSDLHIFLEAGELLGQCHSEFYAASWARARADTFDPKPRGGA